MTREQDVFIGFGLPVLLFHGIVLLLPAGTTMIHLSWPLAALGVIAALLLAWAVYRFVVLTCTQSLLARFREPATPAATPTKLAEPIPANALLRATALRTALREGDIERSLAIIEAGTDPITPALPDESDQRDALTIAATLNDSRPLRALIAAGVDVNHRCHDLTPLLAATRDSYYGRTETVLVLLANGAALDVRDSAGCTPLHHAALSVEAGVAAVLLDARAPIDAVDDEGYTPLARACSVDNAALVPLLLERRAALAIPGAMPALCAAAGATDDETEVVARLLKAKARPDAVDGHGRTALHHAATAGHVRIARLLVDAGAALDTSDRDGRTPLHLACLQHDVDAPIVRLLRSLGADASITDNAGESALTLLSQRSQAMASPTTTPNAASPDKLLFGGHQDTLNEWLASASAEQRAELALTAALQGSERPLTQILSTPLPADARLPDGALLCDAALARWPESASLLKQLPRAGIAVSGGARLARLLLPANEADGHIESLALDWLNAGADPFADADGSGTPLLHAARLGLERLTRRLVECGVDARRGDAGGLTSLHLALRHADDKALRLAIVLLSHGADPEAATSSGETPLGLALDADRTALIECLRWRGWRLPGRRLHGHDLVAAAQAGDIQAVRRLLAFGLAIDSRDQHGCTALIRAAGAGHRALFDELLGQGADASARAATGASALTAALMSGHADFVQRLLDHGVHVDQRLGNDATALIVAAACGSVDGVERLLAGGADVMARDAAGNDALHAAAGFAFGCNDATKVRALLLRLATAGAEIDAVNGAGLTALHIACGAAAAVRADPAGIDAALDILLSRLSAVTASDHRGCTALHYAAAHGQIGAVRRLLARGANAGLRDQGGWTAENYATHYGYTDVAQILRPTTLSAAMPMRPG
jgi:ankyrin repeat protein